MDINDADMVHFWKLLSSNSVKYLMAGGFAVNMHGYSRFINDIDIWIKDNKNNRSNLVKAQGDFGYQNIPWEEIEFIPGWIDFNIGSGIILDILIKMKGLEAYSFDDCYNQSVIATIEDIEVPFLHINHLIANKKAVNRPKDKIDVIELEKIIELRKELGLE